MTAIEKALAPAANGADSNRNIVLPEAGGVPTSGTMKPS
jgi:hypothetical protein